MRFRASRHPTRHDAAGARLALLAGAALVLGAAALHVRRQTRRAEHEHPPRGRFVHVHGTALHYTEHGAADAPPLVILHGSGSMAEEIERSGLVERAAASYRVIVFDRVGHGHSDRLHGTALTPARQADLVLAALRRLEIDNPIVLGHSWGALVAMALGLNHPHAVRALVLLSGYWFPTPRADVAWMSGPAIPLLGALMRHTLAPLAARLAWPRAIKRAFAPTRVPASFSEGYPVWLSLRPSQLHAMAGEAALMIPAVLRLAAHYGELRVPVVIGAGANDRKFSTRWHSLRLHKAIAGSVLHIVDGAGHMLHHDAPELVLGFVDEAAQMADTSRTLSSPARASRRADGPVIQGAH